MIFIVAVLLTYVVVVNWIVGDLHMKDILALIGALLALALMAGCAPSLTPELIEALAKDNASFCGRAGVRGGAGAMSIGAGPAVPIGGWGSTEVEFCRSNYVGATVSMTPNGPITISHGATKAAGVP